MKLNKLIILLLLCCSFFAKAEEQSIVFDSANAAYAEGNYKEAIRMYEQILQSDQESAILYFNLGNAYFKTNNIGKAILQYERAKKLNPDDEDIEENLKLANQKTEDKIEAAPQLFLSQWEDNITDTMTEKEWSLVLICSIIVSLLLFTLYFFSSGRGLRQTGFFGGAIMMIVAICCFFMAKSKYTSTITSDSAIITSASVTVTGSPSEKGTKLFILHEGTKVSISQKSTDWIEIKIANGNVGWVKSTVLEEI